VPTVKVSAVREAINITSVSIVTRKLDDGKKAPWLVVTLKDSAVVLVMAAERLEVAKLTKFSRMEPLFKGKGFLIVSQNGEKEKMTHD
jgi:hypothetical protein